jgi:hypothetical protein
LRAVPLAQALGGFPFWRGETPFSEAVQTLSAAGIAAGQRLLAGEAVADPPPALAPPPAPKTLPVGAPHAASKARAASRGSGTLAPEYPPDRRLKGNRREKAKTEAGPGPAAAGSPGRERTTKGRDGAVKPAASSPAPAPKGRGPTTPDPTPSQDLLLCKECGRRFRRLPAHLRAMHGLSPQQYRRKWKLPADTPMRITE